MDVWSTIANINNNIIAHKNASKTHTVCRRASNVALVYLHYEQVADENCKVCRTKYYLKRANKYFVRSQTGSSMMSCVFRERRTRNRPSLTK